MTERPRLPDIRRALSAACDAEAFGPVRAALHRQGVDDSALRSVLGRVSHGPRDQDEIVRLKTSVARVDLGGPVRFERYALLRAAVWATERVADLPVPDEAKRLLLEEFLWLTRPKDRELRWFTAGGYVFSGLCKLVTLRRFPAGQLHWEVDGLARSTLLRLRWRDAPRVFRALRRLRGIRPAFVPHLAWRRRQIVLSEREHYRSLAVMARALKQQPEVLGFVAVAWFYSPDTPKISPHLAWASQLFGQWGGVAVACGRAGPTSGVLEGSRARRERIRQGAFKPTLGLVVWPRDGMLDWLSHVDPADGTVQTP